MDRQLQCIYINVITQLLVKLAFKLEYGWEIHPTKNARRDVVMVPVRGVELQKTNMRISSASIYFSYK